RDRRGDYAQRENSTEGSDHRSLPDGNQGAAQCLAAKRVQRLAARRARCQRSGAGDAGQRAGAAAVAGVSVMTSGVSSSNERGIAMILALFLVLAASVLGSSLIFVTQTETLSSMNYRLMSQARYGAESGVHSAANYLLNTYVAPGAAGDPLGNFNMESTAA